MTATVPAAPSGAVTPREWVALLQGHDLAPFPADRTSPVQVAMFRFPDLPNRSQLPPMDAHYVSFTLAGRPIVVRELRGRRERCASRPGLSLILPAGEENAWWWNRGTDELHLYVSRSLLAETADAAGVAAPVLQPRFGFEDHLLH